MTINKPLVTVFTLIYNTNPQFVIEAIESIRSNNYLNIQHIIIDDCSPNPEPKRVVKEWINRENYPCEFYEHKTNYGVCKTLNHILNLAKGEFLLGCSDDKIMSDRINSQLDLFQKTNSNLAFVFSDMSVIDFENNLLNESYLSFSKIQISEITHFKNLNSLNRVKYLLLVKNLILAPSVMYRTDILRQIGGFDESLYFEDLDIHSRLMINGFDFSFENKKLTNYRVHSESMSHKPNKKYYRTLLAIYKKNLGYDKNMDEELFKEIKSSTLNLFEMGEKRRFFWLIFILCRKFDATFLKNFIVQELRGMRLIRWI